MEICKKFVSRRIGKINLILVKEIENFFTYKLRLKSYIRYTSLVHPRVMQYNFFLIKSPPLHYPGGYRVGGRHKVVVGVAQVKPFDEFSPHFHYMVSLRGSRTIWVRGISGNGC